MASSPYYTPLAFGIMSPLATIYTMWAHMVLKPIVGLFGKSSIFQEEPLLLEESETITPHLDSSSSAHPMAIVTGCNTGIGLQTAIGLMKRGYHVIFACRSRDKAMTAMQTATDAVQATEGAGAAVWLCPLDLSSSQSITAFGKQFLDTYSELHVLVNNAGINTSGPLPVHDDHDNKGVPKTRDLCFQTNMVGHYQLTRDLLPALLKARHYCGQGPSMEAGRVVTLASVMHHFCAPHFWRRGRRSSACDVGNKAWWLESAAYGPMAVTTYCDSKLAAILFAMELNRRYGTQKDAASARKHNEAPLRAVAVNPGGVNSDIWRIFPQILRDYLLSPFFRIIFLTNEQGSSTSVVGAIGNFEKASPGETMYLQPYWLPQKNWGAAPLGRRRYGTAFPLWELLAPYVGYAVTAPRLPGNDGGAAAARALWEACAELVGYRKE